MEWTSIDMTLQIKKGKKPSIIDIQMQNQINKQKNLQKTDTIPPN